jgi:GAF domain-containing protein
MLRWVRSSTSDIAEPSKFVEFVSELFAQRRKQLGSALKRLGIDAAAASTIIDPTMRAEQLTMQQFAALWKAREPELAIALDRAMQQLKVEEPVCDWAGIYLLYDDVLYLTAYRGAPTPHPVIPRSKGICGAAVEENRTLNIEDVTKDPRYLSCDIRARSELVVPIRNRQGQPVGEVDIDSHQLNAFHPALVRKVEELAARIATQMC